MDQARWHRARVRREKVHQGDHDQARAQVDRAREPGPRREHAPEPHAQVDVLAADRRSVERIPQPQEWLDALEFFVVAFAVVFGLESYVARIERCKSYPRRARDGIICDRCLPVARIRGIHDVAQRFPAKLIAICSVVVEGGFNRRQPIADNGCILAVRKFSKWKKCHVF